MKYSRRSVPFVGLVKKQKRFFTVLSILVLCGFAIYNFSDYVINPPLYVFVNTDTKAKCVIPNIDPFDPRIMSYYNWHPPPLQCDKSSPLFIVDSHGVLQFNKSVHGKFIDNKIDIVCTYCTVRLTDDFHVEFEKEITFTPPIDIHSDVFIVKCKDGNSKTVYENLHHKVDKIRTLEKRPDLKNESEDDLSVLIFGIDSLSRLAAFRKLQKTVAYLQDDLGAYIFKGYNKMGDHTFPNLVGLFTGDTPNSFKISLSTDHCEAFPLIWKNFSEKGYVNFFAEDWPEIATFDQVMPMGFKEPPADHYMRPFFLAMRKIKPMQHDLDMILQFLESKAVKLTSTSSLCYGNRPNHMLVVDYYKQFLHAYRGKLKFAFGWLNELGHNFVNFFELGDNDFLSFLKWMKTGKHLENTMLVFFSDHGSRVDGIRNTYVGRIEDRMPFLAITLPDRFKLKYPHIHENLIANTKKLTSTYDLHATFKDIVNKHFRKSELSPFEMKSSVSISLFRNIPSSRSCWQARIPAHYCACYSSKPINASSPKAQELAKFVVDSINNNLKHVQNICSVLKLHKIGNVEILSDNLKRQSGEERYTIWNHLFMPEESNDAEYRITIETLPGNALFEATLKYTSGSNSYQISDDISRINKFGNQTRCMTNRLLRDYCYCI